MGDIKTFQGQSDKSLGGKDLSNLKIKGVLKDKLERYAKENGYEYKALEIFSLNTAEQPTTCIALIKDDKIEKVCYVLKSIEQPIQSPTGITNVKLPVILGNVDDELANFEENVFDVDLSGTIYKIHNKKEAIDFIIDKIADLLALEKMRHRE